MLENLIEGKELYNKDNHRFIWLGWDTDSSQEIIQTNQYLIINKEEGILLDPGGVHLFSKVVATTSQFIDFSNISSVFFSHQDPDVSSGIAMWLGVTNAKVYFSDKWIRFLPHFGLFDNTRLQGLQDSKSNISLNNGTQLKIIPTHFLHSTGCLSLYDPNSKILFSGDIGAAVFNPGKEYLFVEDFEKHKEIMEPFHKRYMASNIACKKWIEIINQLDVEMICPQHGAIFKGYEMVNKFKSWFSNLECGIDNISQIYGI